MIRIHLLLTLAIGVSTFTASAAAQGNYSAVTAENVVALKLNHYFTPDKKGHAADFEWTFTADEFAIKKADGPIPADLREWMVGKGAKVDEIRGKWRLEAKDGVHIVFFEIKADGKPIPKTAMNGIRRSIYKTAPTVVRIGQPQYVFGIGR